MKWLAGQGNDLAQGPIKANLSDGKREALPEKCMEKRDEALPERCRECEALSLRCVAFALHAPALRSSPPQPHHCFPTPAATHTPLAIQFLASPRLELQRVVAAAHSDPRTEASAPRPPEQFLKAPLAPILLRRPPLEVRCKGGPHNNVKKKLCCRD